MFIKSYFFKIINVFNIESQTRIEFKSTANIRSFTLADFQNDMLQYRERTVREHCKQLYAHAHFIRNECSSPLDISFFYFHVKSAECPVLLNYSCSWVTPHAFEDYSSFVDKHINAIL